MNDLKTFTFKGTEVRTVEIAGEVWFVGRDVAEVLGYSKPQNAIAAHIDEDDALKQGIIDELGRAQETTLINESGLYSLVLSSKLPTAKEFKRWVTSEVLPSIRKHGMYAVDELIANPDLAIAALTALKEERIKNAELTTTVAVQEQQITELKPKASYYDVVLNCKDLLSATEIAKDYGKSAKWLNETLRILGVQFKQSGVWLLYQKYAEKGYTSTKTHNYLDDNGGTHSRVHTYWTQKGRLFIYDLLKSHDILPTMEQAA